MSRMIWATFVILACGVWGSSVLAQEFTTTDVLARLDEKAKVFSSLETSVSHTQYRDGFKFPTEAGKIYVKMAKAPRFFWNITDPREPKQFVIDSGELKAYFPKSNSYHIERINPDSEMLQLLLIGFGVRSATLTKNYNASAKGRESLAGAQAVVLELESISPQTSEYPRITLWLDPQTWTPLRTRVTEVSRDYTDFDYSNVRLNRGVSDSVFNLKIPSNATKR